MKSKLSLIMVSLLSLVSCKEGNKEISTHPAKRMGMVTGIKPDKIEYYKELHAKVWPAILKKIKECNIQNYFLFSYFEYTGDDFEKDMEKMAADSTTQLWWKETDPTQIPLPEAASKKEIWTNMEEVFHTN